MGTMTFSRDTNGGIDVKGNCFELVGTLTGSSSYATGGDSFSIAGVGLSSLDDLVIEGGTTATTAGYSLKLGGTNKVPLILAYDAAGQVANATNLSAKTWKVRLRGKV